MSQPTYQEACRLVAADLAARERLTGVPVAVDLAPRAISPPVHASRKQRRASRSKADKIAARLRAGKE